MDRKYNESDGPLHDYSSAGFDVIVVGRGFSGGHESCCPKNSVQRQGIGTVIVGGRRVRVVCFGQQWSFRTDPTGFSRRRVE
jgi:hypothetical protein